MKRLNLALVLLVLWGVVSPDSATAVPLQQAGNPCGRVVCCCPHMCKMIRQQRLACKIHHRRSCGIQSASAEASLSPFSLAGLRITIVPNSLTYSQARGSKLLPEACRTFTPADRSPLDKPPARTS